MTETNCGARLCRNWTGIFGPEFLNRLDEVIIFHSLTRDHIIRIVDLQLGNLERILAERHISVVLSAAAKTFLAEMGWDPVFGARPLKRAIQKQLQDPLAVAILDGRVAEGDQVRVDVDEREAELKFETRQLEPAAP